MMAALIALWELFVGLLAVLAIGATVWFAGVYIILGLIGAGVLFVIWCLGSSLVQSFKRTEL